MTLTPTDVNELLDERGWLEDSHGPGTYALEVETPDTVDAVARAFSEVSDAVPDEKTLDQLTADKVAYVGASNNVYDRLMDHAEGEVRQTLFLQAFDAVDVIGVWSDHQPFLVEYNQAVALREDGWTVWCDGEVV